MRGAVPGWSNLHLPAGEGLFGRAIRERAVQWTGDYLADERFNHNPPADRLARQMGLRSMVVSPLVAGDEARWARTALS